MTRATLNLHGIFDKLPTYKNIGTEQTMWIQICLIEMYLE